MMRTDKERLFILKNFYQRAFSTELFTTELTENSEKKSYTRTLKNLHLDHREISQRNTEIKIIFISKNLY